MELELRPYQIDALDRIEAAARRGVRRQLGVAATGLGKTIIFCALAERMRCRTLVIAHRDELIEQAAAKVREVWRGVNVGVVKGARNDVTANVVVASIQTLSRDRRLGDLLSPTLLGPTPDFGLVVVDEAHHSAAASYRKVIHAMRCGELDGPLLLGVTATPDRGDGKGLDGLFDEVTFTYDLRWGIAQDYLSDVRGLRVTLDTDLSDLKISRGDYEVGAAGKALSEAAAPEMIADAWREHAADRRTLIFTPTVALAQEVVDAFNDGCELGVPVAASVDGSMDTDTRRRVLAAYARGDRPVLVNCQVLTEGYDEPRTDCIVIARPTRSRALYTQMIGRGTRKHPDKADCLVIDVVGATEEHSLITIPSLFGIEQADRVWEERGLVTDVLRRQVDEHVAAERLTAEEAELFRDVRAAGLHWLTIHRPGEPRRYELSLGKYGDLVMIQLPDETWRSGLRSLDGHKRVFIDRVSMEIAQGVAEDYARKSDARPLIDSDAPWRKRRPTANQRETARKAGIELKPGMTRGEVSDLFATTFGRRKAKARAQ